MNRHQILTGACNGGACYSLGNVEGVNFVAYASGCDIVILANNFERVVTIPGVLRGNIEVSCVDCSTDTGKIAASFGKKIHIFEPTPANTESRHKLDYRWFPTAEIECDSFVTCLSWNTEGCRLLTGGEVIQMWEYVNNSGNNVNSDLHAPGKVSFHLGTFGDEEDPAASRLVHAIADPDFTGGTSSDPANSELDPGGWECVWKIRPANPVTHIKFSPDSFVFASLGQNERLVKIWYEDQKVSQGLMRADSVLSPKKNSVHYTFVYISHPRAVRGFEWRQTSKFMPRGSVANMLVTSCEDNVCRIFIETILPDASLLDMEQFDPALAIDSKYHTQRHKKRFVQRLKNIRQAVHKRRKHPKAGADSTTNDQGLNNSTSVHDFHKFAIHHNGVSPVLHFHLACSINPDTDIPLLPIVGNKDDVSSNFRLHWMNNKELQFTLEAEKLVQDLHQRLIAEEGAVSFNSSTPNQTLSEDGEDYMMTNGHDEEGDEDGDEVILRRKPGRKVRYKENGHSSQSSFTSNEEMHQDDNNPEFPLHLLQNGVFNRLDRKIDSLLLDWHSSPDYVFCIHPVDGSFLVWLIDHLDESTPFTFHQAQASFSSRLPRAFPIPDARSMASNLLMFCNYSRMDIKTVMKMSETPSAISNDLLKNRTDKTANASLLNQNDGNHNMLIPSIHMVTKHSNGSLNLWQASFAVKTKFQNIVSISHISRACGHRFRTNFAACHPVLPLLLTTSHHNIPSAETPPEATPDMEQVGPTFCSELILWQVVPVGPLSKSGGITELCRINNSCPSAFTSVAWVPTLLPSTCLGSYCNSPSALFVASDGKCLRLFQTVIDARSLLMENSAYIKVPQKSSDSDMSNVGSHNETPLDHTPSPPTELFNIISLQSSTHPGCVLELDAISDALQDWQNIQLIHVFQDQLISGEVSVTAREAVVDLSGQHTFDEDFYLVVVEKQHSGRDSFSMLHMWRLTIQSKPIVERNSAFDTFDSNRYESTLDSYNDELSPNGIDFTSSNHHQHQQNGAKIQVMTMSVTTTKVCCQPLSLPSDVQVISASVAAGHLSSASIYPACFAPYLLTTACSDGEVRFWRCHMSKLDTTETSLCSVTSYEFSMEEGTISQVHSEVKSHQEEKKINFKYEWNEWERASSAKDISSSISIPGQPIAVSCAYSGRIAVAYRSGPIRTQPENPEDKLVNLRVVIQECESTGGSEWVHEDTIELNNIKIPDPKNEIDMYMLQGTEASTPPEADDCSGSAAAHLAAAFMTRTRSVPSLSTIQSVKKSISEKGNRKGLLQQKCLVQLDWVSQEEGSHLLTVAVGSKVLIYGQVSNEIASSLNALTKRDKESKEDKRSAFAASKRMTMNKSMVAEEYQEEMKWMRLKGIELTTADGLPPLPMHLNWVRAGILVVGMDNEMQVFTQWRSGSEDIDCEVVENEATIDKRTLTEANLVSAASNLNLCNNFKSKSNFKSSLSMTNIRHSTTISGAGNSSKRDSSWKRSTQNLGTLKSSGNLGRSESLSSLPMLYDSGLFEAARFANPVLPQYHPKLLMELLNFGKTSRVKAILAHLVRCISGGESHQAVYVEEQGDNSHLNLISRQRSLSTNRSEDARGDVGTVTEVEIKSIPPLPLYALITADKDVTPFHSEVTSKTAQSTQPKNDYTDLLDINVMRNDTDDLDAQLQLSSSPDGGSSSPHRGRLHSGGTKVPIDPYAFSMTQADVLREHLFKLNLPGLSGNDQFYLAALAEVVATSQDFTDSGAASSTKEQAMDDCGLRYLLAMRQYQCLVKTLPPVQRLPLLKEGIRTFYLVWAFHSESTQELLSSIPCVKSDQPFWDELKLYGVGWWVTNLSILKTLIIKVANVAFKKDRNPMDASIYYLAMKKKAIVKGLFKTVDNSKMQQFFANDFNDENNKRIAMKNAFHLLGKGLYQHAAAFFLLAGQLDNAVSIILDKLNDLQLAIVVCRLFEDQPKLPDSVRRLFYTEVLGLDKEGKNYDHKAANPDPFIRSMALWQLQDYESSLQTLLEKNVGPKVPREMEKQQLTPPVFNFYNYLRTHPLIIRLRLAASSQQRRTEMVSGFTHQDTLVSSDMTTLDQVTAMERQLFFAAAHAHFQNGCPLIAIEVMRKLPDQPLLKEDWGKTRNESGQSKKSFSHINSSSGTMKDAKLMSLDSDSWGIDKTSTPMNGKSSDRAADLFASGSSFGGNSGHETASSMDWSKPVSSTAPQVASAIDWGAPVSRVHFEDELVLDLGLGDSDEDDDEVEIGGKEELINGDKTDPNKSYGDVEDSVFEKNDSGCEKKSYVDVMAQQYKFIACLKVLMEELGNLATGFEVDGGQLRHQLYIWLEKEVEVLRLLCNYGSTTEQDIAKEESNVELPDNLQEASRHRSLSFRSDAMCRASLHEALKADKHDLQSKVERMARRKIWLKSNQHLLRTLASYCILQGSGGGGLASVHMELLLLLQELQQERPTQQLLSPLPFPTTLPLLSASITSSRSVIADPIRYLQCGIQDLLHAIIEMPLPPNSSTDIGLVSLMRDLSVALSSCIYQSLCDSDSFSISVNDQSSDVGIDGFINPEFSYPSSHLMAGVKRSRPRNAGTGDDMINTPPAKWPGVASLKILLAREKDEDAPKIHILLTESLMAVYVSLLISALSMYDSQMLYRLVANKMDGKTWAALFGGGVKKSMKPEKNGFNMPVGPKDEVAKHRANFALKAMAVSNKPTYETKETFQERFIPPELSMITYFMSKPYESSSEAIVDYDSDDSLLSEDEDDEEDEEDDDDYFTTRPKSFATKKPNLEHKDPNSYSWCLIRVAIIKSVMDNLNSFLPQIGIELSELPNVSPLLHAIMKTLEQWQEIVMSRLDLFSSAPDNYISSVLLDITPGQPKSKLQALLQAENSPFVASQETLPIKRLWFYLVKQENLKDYFLRYVYKRRREPEESEITSMRTSSSDNEQQVRDPMKIIHKEQDIITAFAINQADKNLLTLSTQKDVIELDIGYLLQPPVWLDDDNEYDIETLKNPVPGPEVPEFLVVQTPQETPQPLSGTQTPGTPFMSSPSHSQISNIQTGRGTSVPKSHSKVVKSLSNLGVNNPLYSYHILDRSRRLIRPILRRPVLGVRRIGSHPVLPHYLTGGADGAVRLWEWGHGSPLATLRQAGSFPKVTKVQFTAQGNKCCVSDIEGSICLWQVGLGSNYNKPIMSLQCHNKTTSDFQFVNSSSMIATAGQSTEHKNVCLWDTLLPPRSSLVHAFQCHEQGSPALVYAARQHLLISGGRKGEICIFDLRQRVLKHTFQAHEGPIKCLSLDPDEDYYITGSAEGDMKVWGLRIHQLIFSFPGEHSKATFFKNVGSTSGVAQVAVGPLNHLFSCGVDGSMKFRQLPERELIVHHWA